MWCLFSSRDFTVYLAPLIGKCAVWFCMIADIFSFQVIKKRKWAGVCGPGRALSGGEWSESRSSSPILWPWADVFALHTWLHWLPEQRPRKWNNIQSIYPKTPPRDTLKNNTNNKVYSVWPISTLILSHVSQFHGEVSHYRCAFSLMKELYFTLMEAYFTDPFLYLLSFFPGKNVILQNIHTVVMICDFSQNICFIFRSKKEVDWLAFRS